MFVDVRFTMSDSVPQIQRRLSYSMKMKRKVILYAEENTNRGAGRHFGIDECTIRQWRKQRDRIFASTSSKKTFRGAKSGIYVEVEKILVEYVKERRAQGLTVTRKNLKKEALQEAENQNVTGFKASEGWCSRFMARHGFSIRRRTSVCQKLPPHYEQKLVEYQRYVIQLRRKMDYALSNMGNADETPVYFDMTRSTTIAEKGARDVKILSTGHEKLRVTVMLSVTADGHKLPPFLILKRKTRPKEKFPNDVIVRAQEKGWMTEELMLEWVQLVWNRRPGFSRKAPSMLVLDAFRAHLTDTVKDSLLKTNSNLVVIPGGMTSVLQPLDVSINKPFKTYLKEEYDDWFSRSDLPVTASGNIKKASASEIARWVSSAWAKVSPEIVRKSFKKCCISNSMDGSEDDLLWEEAEDDSSSSESAHNSSEEDSSEEEEDDD